MPYTKCKICNKAFYIKPSNQKRGWGKFCSIDCRSKGQLKGQIVKCFICGNNIYRSPMHIKRSRSGNFFCNKSCQTKWRNQIIFIGAKHSNWKNGEFSYRRILKSNSKHIICNHCGISDPRVLLVHHLDKNRKNNAINNLQWLCYNCHHLIHNGKEILKI